MENSCQEKKNTLEQKLIEGYKEASMEDIILVKEYERADFYDVWVE